MDDADDPNEEMPELATNEEWRRIMVAARKDHQLSQIQLAAKIGVTQPLLSKIENQQTSSKYILRICRILRIPPPEHFEDQRAADWSRSGHVLRNLSPEEYEDIEKMVKARAEAAQRRAQSNPDPSENNSPRRK